MCMCVCVYIPASLYAHVHVLGRGGTLVVSWLKTRALESQGSSPIGVRDFLFPFV